MKIHSALKALIGCTVFLSLVSCGGDKKSPAKPPAPVKTAMVVKESVPVELEAIGTVEAYQTVTVKSRLTAQIERVLCREGQEVQKGDRLLELDCQTFQAELKQAEAALAKDRIQMQYAVEQERRYAQLIKKDYVAKAEYDQMKAAAAAQRALVKSDEARVEADRVQVGYCLIQAPIGGRVGKLEVNEGNVIKAYETELFTINRMQPIYVAFSLPEKVLPQVKKYFTAGKLPLRAAIPDEDRPEEGELTFVDNAIDKTTGTIALKGVFANPEQRLWPGQFVKVTLTLTVTPEAMVTPSASIQQGPEGQYVYVVKSDLTVELRPITAGQAFAGGTVILSGLTAGEQVVTDGQMRLKPGAKVQIKNTPSQAAGKPR